MTELHLNRPGAIGDVIITLQAIERYKQLNPDVKIIYYTDPTWKDLPLISSAVSEVRDSKDFNLDIPNSKNLIGYTDSTLKKHLMCYFGKELGLSEHFYNYGFNPVFKQSHNECFNQLFMLNKKIITIHCESGWSPYKNWNVNNWQIIVDKINELYPNKYAIIQIGSAKEKKLNNVINKLGELSIVESVELIKHASLHLGIDSFSNHATALLPYTPAIILWGSTHPHIFGYGHNINIWKPLKCSPCNKIYDWITKNPTGKCSLDITESYENPQNPCMLNITVEEVFDAIKRKLNETI